MMIVAAARALDGPARLLRRCRPAEHRGQPRQADRRARARAGLRGRRLRRAAGAPAAVHRRPDDRHRRDRGRQHARAVRLLPAARPDRRRLPRRGADRPVRQHQHDRHRRLRAPHDAAARAPAARARSRSTPAQVFVIMRQSRRSFVETIDFRTSPGQPRRRRAGRADPARGRLARPRPDGRRHGPRHLPLRRDRRDAPRLAPPGRDGRGRPRHDRLGRQGRDRTWPRRRRRPPRSCGSIREELDPGGVYTK